jgi:hypothetical protein
MYGASKHFPISRPEDPTGAEFVYRVLPMGAFNSPTIAGRIGNSILRQLPRESSDTYSGEVRENTWRTKLEDGAEIEPR